MKELIHNKVRVIDEFFTEFNQIQKLYVEKSFDFEHQFNLFLANLSHYFEKRGENSKESEILRIKSMLQTVKRGFNPSKMEKIDSGKRELLWGFSYNGIESLDLLLQEIYKKEVSKLIDLMESYANGGLQLIKDKLELNENYFISSMEAPLNFLLKTSTVTKAGTQS